MNKSRLSGNSNDLWIGGAFFLARFILFLSSPYDIIPGLGDFWNFYYQAGLGWPFLDYWTEFPPVFPFINRIIYLLVNGREIAYGYLMALVLSLVQSGSIIVMLKLERIMNPDWISSKRILVYIFLTIGLFYSWAYFDPLAVYFMLLGIYWLLTEKDLPASLALSLGILIKLFPFLVLPAIWKIRPAKTALRNTIIVITLVAAVWAGLFLVNADFTRASLFSQVNKGSWETIWALLDGNTGTGNFDPSIDRLVPETALYKTGRPALISPLISLAVLGGLGLSLLIRSNPDPRIWLVPFVGLTLVIFYLWSPGYSPQWILFLLPFTLLGLPEREGILFSVVLLLIHLLEWPVLLSRGYFWALPYLIPIRTALIILLGIRFYQVTTGKIRLTEGTNRK